MPYMKSLAIDMAPKGVRVNMVSPGSILEDGNTWGRQRDSGSERYKRTLARNPMGRMGTPQEVAACVAFLAGTPASFVSGANFIVDGAITTRGCAVLSQPARTPWDLVGLLVLAGMVAAFHVGKVPPALPRSAPRPARASTRRDGCSRSSIS